MAITKLFGKLRSYIQRKNIIISLLLIRVLLIDLSFKKILQEEDVTELTGIHFYSSTSCIFDSIFCAVTEGLIYLKSCKKYEKPTCEFKKNFMFKLAMLISLSVVHMIIIRGYFKHVIN